MKRFLTIGLPCLLLAVSLPIVWPMLSGYFDSHQSTVLEVNASDLEVTLVSSHLETPLDLRTNVIWCGTFQLAWNELCNVVGEDLHFAGTEPAMVAELNQKEFQQQDLDEASYLALADYVGNGIHVRIQSELLRKFGPAAAPRQLPTLAETPHPHDMVAYAYLWKHLEFANEFEQLDKPLRFKGKRVSCFGIGEEKKESHAGMLPQVVILDYQHENDFVIELVTKSAGDRLILAKAPRESTLRETIATVHRRIAAAPAETALPDDVLMVPRFNFDITRDYDELIGLQLTLANPSPANDRFVIGAVQNIFFQLDEKGVKLHSEAKVSIGCSDPLEPPQRHVMIFDRPFLVMLQRVDAELPYFAMWVNNAELMQAYEEK